MGNYLSKTGAIISFVVTSSVDSKKTTVETLKNQCAGLEMFLQIDANKSGKTQRYIKIFISRNSLDTWLSEMKEIEKRKMDGGDLEQYFLEISDY